MISEVDGGARVLTSSQVEERNRYAVQVVKRVRHKLAGIEFEADPSLHEQVPIYHPPFVSCHVAAES
jgi:hypothetical protein